MRVCACVPAAWMHRYSSSQHVPVDFMRREREMSLRGNTHLILHERECACVCLRGDRFSLLMRRACSDFQSQIVEGRREARGGGGQLKMIFSTSLNE